MLEWWCKGKGGKGRSLVWFGCGVGGVQGEGVSICVRVVDNPRSVYGTGPRWGASSALICRGQIG